MLRIRTETRLRGHVGRVNVVHFLQLQSPDQGFVVSGGADSTVRLWSCARPHDPLLLHAFKGGHAAGDVLDVACSSGAIRLASAAVDKAVCLWDVTAGALWGRLHGHEGQVNACTFKDANILMTASNDGTVRVWDVRARNCAQILPRFSDAVTGVILAGDSTITACSLDGTTRSFDIRTGNISVDTCSPEGTKLGGLALSRDTKRVAVTILGDSNARIALIERETGVSTAFLSGHTNAKVSLGCSFDHADGALLCASEDGVVRFWNLDSKEIICKVDFGEPVLCVSHHNARQAFVACGAQGSLKYFEWE